MLFVPLLSLALRQQGVSPPQSSVLSTCRLTTTAITNSIFAPRRKEAESRTFWDTEKVVRKALETDFGRMLKEDRIIKLMAKCDNEVVKGQKAVAESLEEVAPHSFQVQSMLCSTTAYCFYSRCCATLFVVKANKRAASIPTREFHA